jgi:glutamate-1-semialdehyde 2,1-aminomutase
MTARYARSEALLDRARRTIPLGAQTFSKSITQFPFGVSPYFAARAEAGHVWDADGNRYVDMVNALAAVTLGHCDPDVTAAVTDQLGKGVIFSLSSELEADVAEAICEMVPCAEQVRFGKNGSDATAGAVRIARAFTGRDHVAVCGYHGWQDWYIGATARSKGVPAATRALTHTFAYNDLSSLDAVFAAHPGEVAAVMLEPMNVADPAPGFLEGVAERARAAGAVLIFDETITGFRFAAGGAQARFGVTPDLATFGKGLANGYPLSAVAGRADIMAQMEEVFFSFTMGGECLSLAAAKAVLEKLRREPVLETIAARGAALKAGLAALIARHRCGGFAGVAGDPSWSFFTLADAPTATAFGLKSLFLQEVFARGLLTLGTHNLSFAHTDADIAETLQVYDAVLPALKAAAEDGALRQLLRCEPLEPLFKVR